MIKRLFSGLLVLLALLASVLVINTLRHGSRQHAAAQGPLPAFDEAAAAASLAEAVRARTITGSADAMPAFAALQVHLQQRYPRVHERLQREQINGLTLLYTWPGSDTSLPPLALLAHQDVVPVAPGTEAGWTHPPFDGVIAGGHVWGRGSWDDKGNLIAQLEAVEALLAAGFEPRRTVYLVFGHDEEVGGLQGAAQVAQLLGQRGVRLDFVLDEGLVVTEGILPATTVPVALVGIAEKGYVSVRLVARGAGGHASMPPAPGGSAIGMLSAALARIDATPLPGGLHGVVRQMFDTLAPEMGLVQRVALSNLWLFGTPLEGMLAKHPETNALLRTTTAPTMFHAGDKDNVLPQRAEAVLNFRLLPGDTLDEVLAHVRRVVADQRIEVSASGPATAASRVSSTETAAYGHIAGAVREVFVGSVVAPGLMLGATDARHFEAIAEQVYRFTPIRARRADLARLHGTDERVPVANFGEMIRFYHRLVMRAAS